MQVPSYLLLVHIFLLAMSRWPVYLFENAKKDLGFKSNLRESLPYNAEKRKALKLRIR